MPSTSTPGLFEAPLGCNQMRFVGDLQREMVHPTRRVRRWQWSLAVAEIEEGDERSVPHLEKDVRVGAILTRGGDVVLLDDVRERQAEQILIEMPGLFRIAASVREVVQSLDGEVSHCRPRLVVSDGPTTSQPVAVRAAIDVLLP
jgi:hypothetical protein